MKKFLYPFFATFLNFFLFVSFKLIVGSWKGLYAFYGRLNFVLEDLSLKKKAKRITVSHFRVNLLICSSH